MALSRTDGAQSHRQTHESATRRVALSLISSLLRVWNRDKSFRLQTGTNILFAHGQPTTDLIDQLIARCLSWTRPYTQLDKLLCCVALLIQKHWADIAGTRILDLVLVMLSPGRPGPAGGRTVPGDKILEIAQTSPAACKHLLPVLLMMFRFNMIDDPAQRLLDLCESFGITIRGQGTDVLPWLLVEFLGDNHSTERLKRHLRDETEGRLERFGIETRDYSATELQDMNKAAMERLGNPQIL
ncbi:hypothetical protein B0H19DRAFT_1152381 [Mycena capillaripes]|nr:hypothetical protein B0H19DRAFT_1152381 [Mycena capillaripes]